MNVTDKYAERYAEAEGSRKSDSGDWEDLLADLDIDGAGDDTMDVIESLSVEGNTVVDSRTSADVQKTPSDVVPVMAAPAVLPVQPQTPPAMSNVSFHDFEAFMIRTEGGPDLRIVRSPAIADASPVGISADFEPVRSSKSARSAGKPTRTRPISKVRDAKFLRFIRDLADAVDRGADTADLFRKYRFSNNSKSRAPGALGSSEPHSGSASGGALLAEDSLTASGSGLALAPRRMAIPVLTMPTSLRVLCAGQRDRFSRTAWRYRPWWHEKELPETAARSYRTPADWGYTSNQLTVTLRHIAIKAIAERLALSVFSIRLRLAPEIEARAKGREDQIDWLRERLTKHLKTEFGEAPPFHLVLTRGRQRSLVLLGELTLPYADKEAARQALLKVGGWFTGVDKDALRMDFDPDNGLVNMMVKGLLRTRSPITANRQVDREAKRIYEQEWLPLIGR